jgi:hypothetical protein
MKTAAGIMRHAIEPQPDPRPAADGREDAGELRHVDGEVQRYRQPQRGHQRIDRSLRRVLGGGAEGCGLKQRVRQP